MGNKYNNVFAENNRGYYQGATNSTQRFNQKETKIENGFISFLKAVFQLIGRIISLLLRIALIVIILGTVALILISLMYPESHAQFREISQIIWNRFIGFLTNLLN